MFLNGVLLFSVAFFSEMCGVGYTLAISRNKQIMAVIFSGAIALLNAGVPLSIVSDHSLLVPSILGEVTGTMVMLRLSNRGQRVPSVNE